MEVTIPFDRDFAEELGRADEGAVEGVVRGKDSAAGELGDGRFGEKGKDRWCRGIGA